jgi:hypothetical protein
MAVGHARSELPTVRLVGFYRTAAQLGLSRQAGLGIASLLLTIEAMTHLWETRAQTPGRFEK